MTPPEQLGIDRAEQIARAWQRESPGMPVGSIGVFTRIYEAAKLLADERRRILARIGMDAATLDLLSTLRRSGPPYRLSTRELTTRCLVTAGAITQRVDRAAREGLVRRLPTRSGDRTVGVELTDGGYRAVEAAVGDLLAYEQNLVDVLDPADQKELARLLALLLRGLAVSLTRQRAQTERIMLSTPEESAAPMPGPRTFRKRPTEVQALQWTGHNFREMYSFAGTNFEALSEPDDRDPEATASVFDHLHKTWILVHTGDWIVCDIQRAFHPVRDDVFREIYEDAG